MSPKRPKDREQPKEPRGERFTWKEGDVQIVYDPYADGTRKPRKPEHYDVLPPHFSSAQSLTRQPGTEPVRLRAKKPKR